MPGGGCSESFLIQAQAGDNIGCPPFGCSDETKPKRQDVAKPGFNPHTSYKVSQLLDLRIEQKGKARGWSSCTIASTTTGPLKSTWEQQTLQALINPSSGRYRNGHAWRQTLKTKLKLISLIRSGLCQRVSVRHHP